MTDLVIDHVIYRVRDLAEGAARFLDHYGLASLAGGRHPGHGTANRIIPLGPDYLELVAVVDPDEAAGSAFGTKVLDSAEGWIGVAMRVARIEDHVEPGDEIIAMTRRRPDGVELSWRLTHFERFLNDEGPFLIEWGVTDDLLPGTATARHRVDPTGVAKIEYADGITAVVVALADGGELVI